MIQNTTILTSPRLRLLVLPALIASTLLLASCGGGSESASSAQSADGTKQALAVSGTTATVPGGWAGRAPKYEVINGITVPPEPAPSINNATLAGVDVNKNGVRDDVERQLAKKSQNQTSFAININIAKRYQSGITRDFIAYKTAEQQLHCLAGNGNDIESSDIGLLVANTTARKSIMRQRAIESAKSPAFVDPDSCN